MSRWIRRGPRQRPLDRRAGKTWAKFWIACGIGVVVLIAYAESAHFGTARLLELLAAWIGGASVATFV